MANPVDLDVLEREVDGCGHESHPMTTPPTPPVDVAALRWLLDAAGLRGQMHAVGPSEMIVLRNTIQVPPHVAERFVDEQGRRVTDMFAPQMRTREKAELVAALVNAAPALLDELARLREALQKIERLTDEPPGDEGTPHLWDPLLGTVIEAHQIASAALAAHPTEGRRKNG